MIKLIKYCSSDIATSGCGITCLAMLASYKKCRSILPSDLAEIGNNVSNKHSVDNVGRMLTAVDAIGLKYEEGSSLDIISKLKFQLTQSL